MLKLQGDKSFTIISRNVIIMFAEFYQVLSKDLENIDNSCESNKVKSYI